ncbi:hypothetical protein, partial [Novosphingobium nitrogenifigens]
MKAERLRLKRLQRLEKLRAIARQTALAEAGRAEAQLAQLETLGQRTASLISDYAQRDDATLAEDLVRQRAFVAGLSQLAVNTRNDIARARDNADRRAAEAAAAERRRAAVEDRAAATA